MTERIREFLRNRVEDGPCLVVDLDVVRDNYTNFAKALPDTRVFYAVKANPAPEVLALLTQLGSCFDTASLQEIEMVLAAGCTPDRISYGNTIKKQADIAYAYAHGVRLFAFDSAAELHKLAAAAPGARVFCRLLTSGDGADWPLSRKFGCAPEMAIDLLVLAQELGLQPHGVSFHVGSQQRDPSQWDPAIARAASVFAALDAKGITLSLLNLGGGLPAQYIDSLPALSDYVGAIDASLGRHFGAARPPIVVEPGRYIAGDAGVLHTEVVLVSRKSYDDDERWVYLDTGVFGGLAETLGEAIKYRLVTSKDGGPTGPVVIAGPTCDSVDVLYQHYRYQLPLDLEVGDHVTVLSAGAYTKAYCTEEFNGFEPIPAHLL
jgi:ornithine decarboxylase